MTESQDKYQESPEEEVIDSSEKPQPEKETSSSTEEDVLALEKQLVEKKAELAKEKKIETETAEPIKKEEPKVEEKLEEVVPTPTQVQKQVKQLKDLDQQNQVKALCDLAFQKGLDFAIETAKNLDNPYVLDEFHDTLVDELREKLMEKGELKQL